MIFDLDISQASYTLRRTIGFAERPTNALVAGAKTLANLIRSTFQDQKDPWGRGWEPLSPFTVALRKSGSTTILVDESEMVNSINAAQSSPIEAKVSIGGAGRFPMVHQFGNPNNMMFGSNAPIPARPFAPITPAGQVELPPAWGEQVFEPFNDELFRVIQ